MVKLIIMIEELDSWDTFEATWPRFLHLAESMPGLRREATSRIDTVLFGNIRIGMVHELFFDSLEAAKQAMASGEGRAAGALLQGMTGGQVALFLADHKEDDLSNIAKYRTQKGLKTI